MADLPKFYAPKPCEIPTGAVGVWQIPDLDIMIPVYSANQQTEQKIIDAPNSAAQTRWGIAYDIGDHHGSVSSNGKGRWRMNEIRPGMVAFYVKPAETRLYSCEITAIADVRSYGYMVYGKLFVPRSSLDILNSCCVGSNSNKNYIALFRFKEKI